MSDHAARGHPAAVPLGLALLLAACGGSPSLTPTDCREPSGGTLTVSAENLLFDTGCLGLPAGEPITIVLDNADIQPHNIAIYTDSTRSTQLFYGEIIDGAESIEYSVPGLDPGTYYFDCTVHPAMNGVVVVA